MERIDLGGTWKLLRRADSSIRPATVPGDILSALIASGEAPDPYFDRNELGLQWIGREDWTLLREFEVAAPLLAFRELFLEVETIDTLAELRLNGLPLGTSSNSFTRFRAAAKGFLREGTNLLEVHIASPERAAAAAAASLPYPVPASTYPVSSPHRNLIRKIQCMAGWDWGPCLMTGGIYDGISLVGHDGPRIEYATTGTRRLGEGRWELIVDVALQSGEAGTAEIAVEIAGTRARVEVAAPAGASAARLSLELEGIEAWWPAGQGKQPLYELLVTASPAAARGDAPGGAGGSGAAAAGNRGHELRKRLGFRELSVVSELDDIGRSLTFRVNGRDLFAKGANWIPADALPSRWTPERIAGLLRSARDANMNMLRVWGGGRYESEVFYGLCDELGLLVWQDAAFSCALYPSDPAFLAGVEAELRHQVRRLADHPSLALWCGNNEALGAINWYEESKGNPARYIVDYDRLNEGTIGRVVRELDPGRTFWPSSPSAGPNDFSDNWHSDSRGDMHFWSVWHEAKPFSAYLDVRPRFCSEFGFQSLPSWRTVASFAPSDQLNVTSPSLEHHQRHPRGNSLIVETMTRYFRLPRGFRETLWLSQVQQALAIRTAVEYWRSLRDRCMGALYWQLNDVWPVASWSSLDYDGSWKLLHYEARRFFDPVIISLFVKEGVIHAYGVNDGQAALHGVFSIRLRRFDGRLAMDLDTDGDLPPGASTLLWKAPVADLPCRPDEAYLATRLEASAKGPLLERPALVSGLPSRSGGTAEVLRRNQLFLVEPKRCNLVDPLLEHSFEEGPDGPFLAMRARHPAFWVSPEADGLAGRFEDSGIYLMGREERRLRWIPDAGAAMPTTADLEKALRITHLRGSYD